MKSLVTEVTEDDTGVVDSVGGTWEVDGGSSKGVGGTSRSIAIDGQSLEGVGE